MPRTTEDARDASADLREPGTEDSGSAATFQGDGGEEPVRSAGLLCARQSARDIPRLNEYEQAALLDQLALGASLPIACRSNGLEYASVVEAIAHDSEFEHAIRVAELGLSQNVAAALYRAAMEGNVSAQQYWLTHRPPDRWPSKLQKETHETGFEQLSDERLVALARAKGVGIPDGFAH